ncbi:hypothetical protein EW146_g1164 [Bondarzewia mesenterica]|uniref:Cyclin N-terminal domain-containing protein n=1 Tax=Bondarzewia mesenterica TaxID=1095465 RepID=A0A4S4M4N6_9AGAM|nr:hypothetical protein EW146_g1164 [Bondarzewia mesenterica]
MPVPVPQQIKAPAHPVFKPSNRPGHAVQQSPSVFRNLTHSLPLPPLGPPPSFGTREEWISSLPSWRRNKPRRIWEEEDSYLAGGRDIRGFQNGLTDAGNTSVIKGDRAQACIPPALTLITTDKERHATATRQQECEADAVDGMSSNSLGYDIESQWSGHSSDSQTETDMEVDTHYRVDFFEATAVAELASVYEDPQASEQVYDRGAFTPVFEDMSPEATAGHPSSSPVGPVTPFADFVDRAVAANTLFSTMNNAVPHNEAMAQPLVVPQYETRYDAHPYCSLHSYKALGPQHVMVPPPSEPMTTPSYKKVADPLADWMASYVWKACMTSSVHIEQSSESSSQRHPFMPPSHLANSIRSLFMSTLLQPSAIILAVWYIVRLPISFGPVVRVPDGSKETRFRAELLGVDEWQNAANRDAIEQYAPFRLVLLGCMLANKWLDDHTFSNKTWHTISNVPIQSLNRLESLALDLFSYDLSIKSREWSQWLRHVLATHMSLSSPSHPQPISRPSSNPHTIIRKAIEELIDIAMANNESRACGDGLCPDTHPEPVFVGLEERKRAKLDCNAFSVDPNIEVLEIDLDEDGPLREEYVPRRRVSKADSIRGGVGQDLTGWRSGEGRDWERAADTERTLPPPAKWSPAADEPILREERRRQQSQYVAVQPPMAPPLAPILAPLHSYNPMQGLGYHHPTWSMTTGYMPQQSKLQLPPIYPAAYDYSHSAAHSHSRSVSFSNGQHGATPHFDHSRSQSQTHLEYACSDIRLTAQKMTHPPPAELHWTGTDQYGYGVRYGPLAHDSVFPYLSSWIRA